MPQSNDNRPSFSLKSVTQNDIALAADLAQLHGRCLPESILTLLGSTGLTKAYRLLAASEFENVFAVVSAQGHVAGGAVVSFSPNSVSRRLARHPSLAPYLVFALTRKIWRAFRTPKTPPTNENGTAPQYRGPEVLSLYVTPAHRMHGLGAELLAACVQATSNAHFDSVTIYAPGSSEAALKFYQKAGFRDQGPARVRGQDLRLLSLTVAP